MVNDKGFKTGKNCGSRRTLATGFTGAGVPLEYLVALAQSGENTPQLAEGQADRVGCTGRARGESLRPCQVRRLSRLSSSIYQEPGERLNWNTHPLPGRCSARAKSNSPTANPSKFTRRPTPTLDTSSALPPRNDGFAWRSQATPPSANKATSTGSGPYILCETPKGLSSGKRNSRLATRTRLPIRRSNAGHSLAAVGTHSLASSVFTS